jgi:hypothetical protein
MCDATVMLKLYALRIYGRIRTFNAVIFAAECSIGSLFPAPHPIVSLNGRGVGMPYKKNNPRHPNERKDPHYELQSRPPN